MSKYPMSKYNLVVHQNKTYNTTEIIALSTYASKVVKGKAICHINDSYDESKGAELAVARCAEKIARKRQARAARLLAEAKGQLAQALKYVNDMQTYYDDAVVEVADCKAELEDILHTM